MNFSTVLRRVALKQSSACHPPQTSLPLNKHLCLSTNISASQTCHKVSSPPQARPPPQNSRLLHWRLHFTRRRGQPVQAAPFLQYVFVTFGQVHIFQGQIPVRAPQTARATRAHAGRGYGVAEVSDARSLPFACMPPTIT